MFKLLLLVVALSMVAGSLTEKQPEKKKHHCETDADCSKDNDRCQKPNAVCACEGKSWCSIKYKCDPAKNGEECPSFSKKCLKSGTDTEFFCAREEHSGGAPGTSGLHGRF
ncbi:unnamed protein product, partial [Mesorhabditis belari]|uniref:Uncharacterized protein n=1 Tax=Mesorhabditis belari TaxID=2138241 RepID=A0AAF3F206_9BILA